MPKRHTNILLTNTNIVHHSLQFSSSFTKQNTSFLSSDNGDGTYTNPLIKADYPDPDIIRVGEDYYMVSSSFVAMPGIPICHSKGLINWEIIGHAYDSINFRPQYRMENEQTVYSRLCWAPSIKYDKSVFYIGVNIADNGFPRLCHSLFCYNPIKEATSTSVLLLYPYTP